MVQEWHCPKCKVGTVIKSSCCQWECLDCDAQLTYKDFGEEEAPRLANLSIRNAIRADESGSV